MQDDVIESGAEAGFAEGWEVPAEGAIPAESEPREEPEEFPGETSEEAPEGSRSAGPEEREQDFRLFLEMFPGVGARDVPREVWERVQEGESLCSAYQRYNTEALQEELMWLRERAAALEREQANRRRSAGSQRTAGSGQGRKDPFDQGWDSM